MTSPRCAMRSRRSSAKAQEAKLQWRPLNTTLVEGDTADSLMKLIDALEDNDDVQNVYANYEVSEETLQRLSA